MERRSIAMGWPPDASISAVIDHFLLAFMPSLLCAAWP
jgi:hypothetical protein